MHGAVLRCRWCTDFTRSSVTCQASPQPSLSVPAVPGKRPIRSRKLPPELHDPEETALHTQYYRVINPPPSQSHPVSTLAIGSLQLPHAYQPAIENASVNAVVEHQQPAGMQQQELLEKLQLTGGYMMDDSIPLQLIGSYQVPTVRELLKLGPNYEDDFFRGPDYRYTVDDRGRILDMIYVKRARVPEAFQHAITSAAAAQPGAQQTLLPSTSLAGKQDKLRGPRLQANPKASTRAQGEDSSMWQQDAEESTGWADDTSQASENEAMVWEQEADDRYEYLGVNMTASAGQQSSAQQVYAIPEPTASAPTPPSTLRSQSSVTSRLTRQKHLDDSYLDELGDAALLPASPTQQGSNRSQISPQQVGTQQQQQQQQQQIAGSFNTQLSSGRQIQLRVYPYCIGRNDVFNGLWELGLLDQVTFTDDLDSADIILHRRAKPSKRQFAYDRLRARAKERGIPFVTVNNGTAEELQTSLTPVFQLIQGVLSPQQVLSEYGPAAKGSKGRRVRL